VLWLVDILLITTTEKHSNKEEPDASERRDNEYETLIGWVK
jgi:hypothetical protein